MAFRAGFGPVSSALAVRFCHRPNAEGPATARPRPRGLARRCPSAGRSALGVRSGKGGTVPRMTIRTSPGRTMTPVAPRRTAPQPLIVTPGTIAPGRAHGAAPLRREGPAKLTGAAKYADD